MIDIHNEHMIRIPDACRYLTVGGGRLCYGTVYRWMLKGKPAVGGGEPVLLESVNLAGRYTSIEACDRFIAATAPQAAMRTAPTPPPVRMMMFREGEITREIAVGGTAAERTLKRHRVI